jgi:MerR family transcriptional regulator, thiopeptide resistance regulator
MAGDKVQWLGPGETAQRLGVSIKALRVYEREGLVAPHRTEGGWRAYGPAELARLHQVIVLRDLGFPLKAISRLLANPGFDLSETLALQRQTLLAQQGKIARAIELLDQAAAKMAGGSALSLDDLSQLTKETIVQSHMKEFESRVEALVAERDPSGQASLTFEKIRSELKAVAPKERIKEEAEAFFREAKRLQAIGDPNSEDATRLVRRWLEFTKDVSRLVGDQKAVLQGAVSEAMAEAENPPLDAAQFAFIREVAAGMKARGEIPA